MAAALQRAGRLPVQRNVILKDSHGNRSEIDVVAGPPWQRTYIECKAYHGSGSSVGLEEVAKFKEVLALNGIPLRSGLFITTTGYVPRARTTGLRTLDAEQLLAWEAALAWEGRARRAAWLLLKAAAALSLAALAAASLPAESAEGAAQLLGSSASELLQEARSGWRAGLGQQLSPEPGSASLWAWAQQLLGGGGSSGGGGRGGSSPPSSQQPMFRAARSAGEWARALKEMMK